MKTIKVILETFLIVLFIFLMSMFVFMIISLYNLAKFGECQQKSFIPHYCEKYRNY